MQFLLSKKEIELIKYASEKSKVDISQVKITPSLNDEKSYILDSDNMDLLNDIREACGDLLVTIGFTQNDEPTEEGRVLEGLMDKLFVE